MRERRTANAMMVRAGAAALVMSVAAARRLGVPEEKWVYLHGHADQTERDLLDRVDVSISYSAKQAVAEALRGAGIDIDAVAKFDLYSCFPFPVFAVCDEFGLAAACSAYRRRVSARHRH